MFEWLGEAIETIDMEHLQRAQLWQDQLTKPKGALGTLENLAVRIAALQKTTHPSVNKASIIIYVADHGIAQEQVSAFPQSVTAEMVKNFSSGGAAISVLSRQHHLPLQIVNLGLVTELPKMALVDSVNITRGTENFLHQPAMTSEQLSQVFDAARTKVDLLKKDGCELLIAGEMGIANTTSATALLCALKSIAPEQITGSGTGLDLQGINHKAAVIKKALEKHKNVFSSALSILQTLGGLEIAALTASYIRCAQQGIMVLVDGFICSVAAMFAIEITPECKDWLIFSHQSAERGHKILLDILDVKPLLQFDLRLGEGSGAALVFPLIRSSCLLQSEMASFSSASVSEKLEN